MIPIRQCTKYLLSLANYRALRSSIDINPFNSFFLSLFVCLLLKIKTICRIQEIPLWFVRNSIVMLIATWRLLNAIQNFNSRCKLMELGGKASALKVEKFKQHFKRIYVMIKISTVEFIFNININFL